MNDHICADTFLVNTLGNIACVFRLEDRSNVKAPYGTTTFTRKLKLTPGTYVDTSSEHFGFRMVLDPPRDSLLFPAGVTISEPVFNPETPDVTGGVTEETDVFVTFGVTVDRDEYAGGLESVKVTLVFNPGA